MRDDGERRRLKRQQERQLYRRKMDDLHTALGGKCALAGTSGHTCSNGALHVDHVDGREWEMNALSSVARVNRLVAEHKAGVRLRLLCSRANGWDGYRRAKYGD